MRDANEGCDEFRRPFTMSQCPSMPQGTIRRRWRFAIVLAASLLLAVAQPLTSGLFGDEGSFDVSFSLLTGAVMLLVFEERERRIIAISLGLIAIFGIWTGYALGGFPGRVLLVGSHLLAACVFAFALYRILRAILVNQASGDAIFGAVCGYLLLGIIWCLCIPPRRRPRPDRSLHPPLRKHQRLLEGSIEASSAITASLLWPRWGMET